MKKFHIGETTLTSIQPNHLITSGKWHSWQKIDIHRVYECRIPNPTLSILSNLASRRIVWEFIVWPLILQTNRQYFTIHEYRRKMSEFAKINSIQSGSPIHYRLIPYLRKKVKLEYGLTFREIYSKHYSEFLVFHTCLAWRLAVEFSS
jgi:hypothetical protein